MLYKSTLYVALLYAQSCAVGMRVSKEALMRLSPSATYRNSRYHWKSDAYTA